MRGEPSARGIGDDLSTLDRAAYIDHFLEELEWIELADALVNAAKAQQPQVDAYWAEQRARARNNSPGFPSDAAHRIQLMLFSFAVENLMKAFLIREKKTEYETRMRTKPNLPKELKTHDLVKLAIAVGEVFPRFKRLLDRDCEELLRRLTRRAEWSGRYPVPTDYRALTGIAPFLDGTPGLLSQKFSNDPHDALRLVNELCHTLNLHLKNAAS